MDPELTLARFYMEQSTLQLNGAAGEKVIYTSHAPFPIDESIVIKNATNQIVRHLFAGPRATDGPFKTNWDGRDDAGQLLPDGPYWVSAIVTHEGQEFKWDLISTYMSDGFWEVRDDVPIVYSPIDPFNNKPLKFSYSFSQAGLVTLAVYSKTNSGNECNQPQDQALCMIHRQYQEAGTHTFTWAGVDFNGIYVADKYPRFSVTSLHDRFSQNAVVLYGTKPTINNLVFNPPAFGITASSTVLSFDLATYENQPVMVTIAFQNQNSGSVLRTITLPAQSPGQIAVPWDGKADNGAWVAPGYYTITVTVEDSIGNKVKGQALTTVFIP